MSVWRHHTAASTALPAVLVAQSPTARDLRAHSSRKTSLLLLLKVCHYHRVTCTKQGSEKPGFYKKSPTHWVFGLYWVLGFQSINQYLFCECVNGKQRGPQFDRESVPCRWPRHREVTPADSGPCTQHNELYWVRIFLFKRAVGKLLGWCS